MANSVEIHEIQFKSDFAELKKLEAEYKRLTSSKIAQDKIDVDNSKTSNRIKLEDAKLVNKLAYEDYKDTKRKMAQADKDFQKQSGKFTGQSVELGSQAHIQGLRSQLRTMMPGTESYTKLDTQLKNLVASYNAARGSNSLFNRGLLETGENIVTITAGLYLAANAVINFGKESVKAFNEQEKSLIQLKAVLGDNDKAYKSFISFASQMQDKWGIPDEQTESIIAFGVAQGRSEEQIKKNFEAARILSLVMGTDIVSASKLVDATFEGNVRSLGRMEKDFKGLTEEQLQNGAAVDLIISKYGKLGDIENSSITKTAKLTQGWEETKETIGEVIVDALSPLGEGLANVGLKGQDVIKFIAEAVVGLGVIFKATRTAVDAFKSLEVGTANLIISFTKMGEQLPVLGSFYSTLTSYAEGYKERLLQILGLQQNMGGATFTDAHGGTRSGINLKEPEAKGSNPFSGKGPSGKTRQTEQKEELNFLEQYNKKIKDLQAEIKLLNELSQLTNLKDYEKIVLKDELIKKQKELNELLRQNLGLEATGPTGSQRNSPAPPQGKQNGKPNEQGYPQGMLDTEEAIKDLEKLRLQYAQEMGDNFLNMLNLTGLIDEGFMKILNQIKAFISGGVDLVSSIIGFAGLFAAPFTGVASIPIAAGVGGIAGTASPLMHNNSNLVNVAIYNPITLREGLRVETRIDNTRGGIDL